MSSELNLLSSKISTICDTSPFPNLSKHSNNDSSSNQILSLLEKSWNAHQEISKTNAKWIEILPNAKDKLKDCLNEIEKCISKTSELIEQHFETREIQESIQNHCRAFPFLTSIRNLLPLLSKITRQRKNVSVSNSLSKQLEKFAIQQIYKSKCERLIDLVSNFKMDAQQNIRDLFLASKPLLLEIDETHCDGWTPKVRFLKRRITLRINFFLLFLF